MWNVEDFSAQLVALRQQGYSDIESATIVAAMQRERHFDESSARSDRQHAELMKKLAQIRYISWEILKESEASGA